MLTDGERDAGEVVDEMSVAEPTPLEEDNTDTVECAGYCDRTVFEAATVDVVAGATIGEWDTPHPHTGVTGVDGGQPHVEQWCLTCAQDQFPVDQYAAVRRDSRDIHAVWEYVTPATVTAFLLGALGTLVAASVVIV